MAQVEQATSKKGKRYLIDNITTFEDVQATNISADNITSGTMSADRITGGTLKLGGANNINGTLEVLNASGQVMGTISGSAMSIKSYDLNNPTFRLYNETEDEYAYITNRNIVLVNSNANAAMTVSGDETNALSIVEARANGSYVTLTSYDVPSISNYSTGTFYGFKDDNNNGVATISGSKSGAFIQLTSRVGGVSKQLYLSPSEISIGGGTGVTATCTVKVGGVDKTMTIKNGIVTSIA